MTDPSIFAPRDRRFKTPYGAAPSGTKVNLTLRPTRSDGYVTAVLLARFEAWEDKILEIPMASGAPETDRDCFSAVLETGDYVGLVWYSFRLEAPEGGVLELGEYQLTVYDAALPVPAWFGEGVTYQIFPDRFRRRTIPDPKGLVGGRSVHTSWYEEPEYRPDENGEIRNRDFFGGSLAGVMEKLDYIRSLGVDTIYFNPIFEGAENHRYGTADYETVDPMLGTNGEFERLCAAAHRLGMQVILDGVFNHTGFVSRYFNGDGFYPGAGAAQSQDSPFYPWFAFTQWPDLYDSWWGIYSLPAVNESEESYVNYIYGNEDSIVRRWLRAGADGWRLDVADELPDPFISGLRAAVREEKPEAVVIGEVWEDGSTKVAYGVRRKHILGGHLDGLMNYPFRTALLNWLLSLNAGAFYEEMERIRENYPPPAFYAAMNSLGTHDTPRILTLLGVGSDCGGETKDWKAEHRLSKEERALGLARLRLGSLIQFAFPGSPTVYYGDEAGMEGFEDPFNRRAYPWGLEDHELIAWYAALGRAREELDALRRGDIHYVKAEGPVLAFTRTYRGQTVLAAANAGDQTESVELPWTGGVADGLTDAQLSTPKGGLLTLRLPPMTGRLLYSQA